MATIEKLIARLLSNPRDFIWEELIKVLNYFGYQALRKRKTGSSRRKFVNDAKHIINLHQPHPGNTLKRYQLRDVVAALKERGHLKGE